jgi:hypothetical protein
MKENTPQDQRQAPAPNPEGGSFITLEDAAQRTKRFREEYVLKAYGKEEKIKGNYFSKEQLLKLLRQPGCTGIRIYNAVRDKVDKDPEGNFIDRREVIIAATDKDGNDILEKGNPGCSPFSVFMALPASSDKSGQALLLGNPAPCPNICGKPNSLNGNLPQ